MARTHEDADVIDVDSLEEYSDIPAELLAKTEQHLDDIVRIRIQKNAPGTDSWNLLKTGRKIPKGKKSAEEICEIALNMARRDQENTGQNGAKYRAYYDIEDENGGISHKYAIIKAVQTSDGETTFEDDASEAWSTPVERALAESLDAERMIVRRQGALMLDTWERFASTLDQLGKSQAKLIESQAKVGESMAAGQKGVADAMLQAGQLYRESQGRGVEQERIRVESQLINREMDREEKKWDMLERGFPVLAMVAAKQMGIKEETAIQMIALMSSMAAAGDESAMMGQLQAGAQQVTGGAPMGAMAPPQAMAGAAPGGVSPQAGAPQGAPQAAQAHPVPAQWVYPGPIDLDRIDGQGAAFQLGAWFAELIEDEEREVRKIVGESTYDGLRLAPTLGDKAAGDVLRDFASRVGALAMAQKLMLFGALKKILGDESVSAFQTLVAGATSGRL